MIAEFLAFLRRYLDERLRLVLGGSQDDAIGDRVVFVDGDKMDPLVFQLGAVTALLVNLEEERLLRSADLHVHQGADGVHRRTQPEIRLILYVLFAARFKKYEAAWAHLSRIIELVQSFPVLEPACAPELPAGIERIVMELVPLDFARQNEVWSALRTTHHPSVLYRIKMLAYRDRYASESTAVVEQRIELRRPA